MHQDKVAGILDNMKETLSRLMCRPFTPADLRALYAIEEACFESPQRFSRALMRSLTHDPDCRTWVALVDGVCAGFAIVGLREPNELPGTATGPENAYIWTIEVLPFFRRKGVARQLLRRMEESAREVNAPAIELHVAERNGEARALYESAGFVAGEIVPKYYGPEGDGRLYRKMLQS
jgi:[ribosomal protein S18]-alanine N-acetyltransferase